MWRLVLTESAVEGPLKSVETTTPQDAADKSIHLSIRARHGMQGNRTLTVTAVKAGTRSRGGGGWVKRWSTSPMLSTGLGLTSFFNASESQAPFHLDVTLCFGHSAVHGGAQELFLVMVSSARRPPRLLRSPGGCPPCLTCRHPSAHARPPQVGFLCGLVWLLCASVTAERRRDSCEIFIAYNGKVAHQLVPADQAADCRPLPPAHPPFRPPARPLARALTPHLCQAGPRAAAR